jgi:UDP:flavonoid glycosyltransferase YjiC (YdhE family)
LLPTALTGLAGLPVTVIAATAGRVRVPAPPANARLAEFLSGEAAVARAAAVVCNGGSPATQQALAGAVPVVGIVTNLDQHLNMQALAQAGAGIRLRAERVTPARVAAAVTEVLSAPHYRDAAARGAGWSARYRAPERLAALLETATGADGRCGTPHRPGTTDPADPSLTPGEG